MRSALYYPHSEINSETLLCAALLLYDQLEFLAPDDQYQPYYGDPLFAEAFELFGRRHVPNDYEKKQTHDYVEQFLAVPEIPKCLLYDPDLAAPEFGLYPEKLLPETWDLLWRRRIIAEPKPPSTQATVLFDEAAAWYSESAIAESKESVKILGDTTEDLLGGRIHEQIVAAAKRLGPGVSLIVQEPSPDPLPTATVSSSFSSGIRGNILLVDGNTFVLSDGPLPVGEKHRSRGRHVALAICSDGIGRVVGDRLTHEGVAFR